MNGSHLSRDGRGSKNTEDEDNIHPLCDRFRLCEMNERPRLSLEQNERATTSPPHYGETVSSDLCLGVGLDAADVNDLLWMNPRVPRDLGGNPMNKPGGRSVASYDNRAGKMLSCVKPEPAIESRIEVAPGIRARLRGAKETMTCVENDYYLPAACLDCSQDLFCIMDASFVLCPTCKVVNPFEGCADGLEGGVGIGFTYDDLREIQEEILLRRQGRLKY